MENYNEKMFGKELYRRVALVDKDGVAFLDTGTLVKTTERTPVISKVEKVETYLKEKHGLKKIKTVKKNINRKTVYWIYGR